MEVQLRLIEHHPAQKRVVKEASRFNVLACGRRFGKSVLGIDRILDPALDGYPVGWFSPTYKMLSEIWRDVRKTLTPITTNRSEQEHRIELVTGGIVDMWSLDTPDVARGRKYKLIVIDEAAMVHDLGEAWNAVIRPTLTDYQGDAWFLSTPKGRNFFWELWQRGQDGSRPEYKSWQMPTLANPHIKPSEVESARRELPERIFQQEYLAQFLDDGGAVFRQVPLAATATVQDAAIEGHTYVFGVDWGKHEDFSVFSVIDTIDSSLVHLDRFNQIDYTVQTARLKALAERFNPRLIVAERNSMGEPLIEQLQRDGLSIHPFTTTNASKTAAIDALSLAFERGIITIPNDPVLIGELQAYEMERLPSGLLRYSAPSGMHDDCVMSLALAWSGCGVPSAAELISW